MTETDTKTFEEMKSYLFGELDREERERLEDRFFADDEFFYELAGLEEDLVDRYVRGELAGEELSRFERSIERVPERREKIANARALRVFIGEEKKAAAEAAATATAATTAADTAADTAVADRPSFWEKIREFFTLQMPALQYAAAGLILLLLAGSSYLLYERYRLESELAAYRDGQNTRVGELERREKELGAELANVHLREKSLESRLEEKTGETDILGSQLEREQNRRRQLERKLERLRREKGSRVAPDAPRRDPRPKPQIATVVLTPFAGTRGGPPGGGGIKTLGLPAGASAVSATLQFPKDAAGESFTVRFRGRVIVAERRAQTTRSGYKFITVTIPAERLAGPGRDNVISAADTEGNRYSFVFRVRE